MLPQTVSNPNCTDVTDNPANVSRRRCLIANPLRSNSVVSHCMHCLRIVQGSFQTVLNCGLYWYSLKVSAGVKFRLSQDKEFTESNYTLKFNVSSAGEGKELNTTDNTESTTVTVNRVADLIISRYVINSPTSSTSVVRAAMVGCVSYSSDCCTLSNSVLVK